MHKHGVRSGTTALSAENRSLSAKSKDFKESSITGPQRDRERDSSALCIHDTAGYAIGRRKDLDGTADRRTPDQFGQYNLPTCINIVTGVGY